MYRDLELGDRVCTFAQRDHEYDTATVVRIDGGLVHFVRPHIVWDINSGTWSIGIEQYNAYTDSQRTCWLLYRPPTP